MRMQKKTFGTLLLAGMMVFNVGTNVAAEEKLEADSQIISGDPVAPCFIALWDCTRSLELANSFGKMNIYASTDTYPGYTSSTTTVLQKKNGSSWDDITSWENNQGSTDSTIGTSYYVNRGTYRTMNTHTAYNSSGYEVESHTTYSDEVTY